MMSRAGNEPLEDRVDGQAQTLERVRAQQRWGPFLAERHDGGHARVPERGPGLADLGLHDVTVGQDEAAHVKGLDAQLSQQAPGQGRVRGPRVDRGLDVQGLPAVHAGEAHGHAEGSHALILPDGR